MTYSELLTALEAVCDTVREWEAPERAQRFIVVSPYGADAVTADDTVRIEITLVQLDVCWQQSGDALLADVKAALTAHDTPYSVENVGYDPDYNAMRAILELEVL